MDNSGERATDGGRAHSSSGRALPHVPSASTIKDVISCICAAPILLFILGVSIVIASFPIQIITNMCAPLLGEPPISLSMVVVVSLAHGLANCVFDMFAKK